MRQGDPARLGWLPLQDHRPIPVELRHVLGAARIGPSSDSRDPTLSYTELGLLGGGLLWRVEAGKRGDVHGWWLTPPAVAWQPGAGVGWRPILGRSVYTGEMLLDGDFAEGDDAEIPRRTTLDIGSGAEQLRAPVPAEWPCAVAMSADEDRQEPVLVPGAYGLWTPDPAEVARLARASVARAQPTDGGMSVYAVGADGRLTRSGGLGHALSVFTPADSRITIPSLEAPVWISGPAARRGTDAVRGVGRLAGLPVPGTAQDGGAPPPILLPGPPCPHALGQGTNGEAVGPAHFNVEGLFWLGGTQQDGPLLRDWPSPIRRDVSERDLPFRIPTIFGFDADRGVWRWQTPVVWGDDRPRTPPPEPVPREPDPTPTPTPFPEPEPEPEPEPDPDGEPEIEVIVQDPVTGELVGFSGTAEQYREWQEEREAEAERQLEEFRERQERERERRRRNPPVVGGILDDEPNNPVAVNHVIIGGGLGVRAEAYREGQPDYSGADELSEDHIARARRAPLVAQIRGWVAGDGTWDGAEYVRQPGDPTRRPTGQGGFMPLPPDYTVGDAIERRKNETGVKPTLMISECSSRIGMGWPNANGRVGDGYEIETPEGSNGGQLDFQHVTDGESDGEAGRASVVPGGYRGNRVELRPQAEPPAGNEEVGQISAGPIDDGKADPKWTHPDGTTVDLLDAGEASLPDGLVAHGAFGFVRTVTEEMTIQQGGMESTISVPVGARVVGATARLTETIAGVGGEELRLSIGFNQFDAHLFVEDDSGTYPAGRVYGPGESGWVYAPHTLSESALKDVLLRLHPAQTALKVFGGADGDPSAGKVRVALHYVLVSPPTS